ncbi:TraB/GumN family protein [Priestia taiwanensis]|uniref:TraB/GumN family protein n=1 Tax=Priestia taiwanensis TaxID=1347902 RepID=A0A917AQY7_9BACI|nr:TraB/GumN family protein [Priestia taiwanensis]MBM7363104.1 uncharacterized protein YbaP (TraB family) [Priestia taiwanensis]GGE67722.1 hypothetical protein GCM10007140_17250 [Priestia taiwanensis]
MKHIIKLLFSLFTILLLAVGCSSEPKETSTPKEPAKKQETEEKSATSSLKPLLWEVKHGDATVYLFGTKHLGKPEYYPLPSFVNDAFTSSDTLVTEIIEEANMENKLLDFMYKNGETVESHISPETATHIKKRAEEYGIDYNMLKIMNPEMIGITFTQMSYMAAGYSPDFGLDSYFTEEAKKTEKKHVALETMDSQLELLYNQYTKNEAEQELMKIKSKEEAIAEVKEFAANYLEGNEEALMKEIIESSNEEQYKSVVYDRNINMTKKVEEYLKTDKTYFVAVGAAHVIGKDGMVAMLKEKGYSPMKVEK